jgi:hypothetical protein
LSFLFTLDESKLTEQLPPIFAKAEKDIAAAAPLFEIEGSKLEALARDVPQHQAHYSHRALELKALMQWLETRQSRQEAEALKRLLAGQRAFSASDQKILIGGTSEIIETKQLIIEATQFYRQFEEIAESFKQMGWMVGHITKLRVAELGDVII